MNDVDEIKRRINILDFVQSYVPLKKAGNTWRGLCPFHQEKTPSFHVNADRQTYKCFGCNEGGDALDFLMKMEHLTFPEALQLLADRVGYVLDRRKTPEQYKQEKDEKSRLYRINRVAADLFHKILVDHPKAQIARDYLASRGLSQATIREFRLGFAPPIERGVASVLEKFLTERGFSRSELKSAGSPERFGNRIMFPLFDVLGNPIGFTGRTLDDKDQPKYLNTPETPLFKKSRVLYPLHQAKDAIKAAARAVFVEGQTDVLISHQLGIREVVASSGTALTAEHLEIIRRYTNRVVFAFDADGAGIEATRKAIMLAYDSDLEPFVAVLPDGFKDVGELGVAKPELWPEALTTSRPAVRWQLDMALSTFPERGSASWKKQIGKSVLPVIDRITDPIERAHWVQVLGRTLGVPERSIVEALGSIKRAKTEAKPAIAAPTKPDRLSPQENLLGLLIAYPHQLSTVATRLEEAKFADNQRMKRLVRALATIATADKATDQAAVLAALKTHLEPGEQSWVDGLVATIEQQHQNLDPVALAQEIRAAFDQLDQHRTEGIKTDMAAKIAQAEASGDRAAVQNLLKDLQKLLK